MPGPTDTALLRSFLGDGEYGQKLYERLRKSIPLKRLGQPDDIPGLVAFLSSDDADFMTGQVDQRFRRPDDARMRSDRAV